MKGLASAPKELARLQALNGVMERLWLVTKAEEILGVTECHGQRLLAAYRREGVAALAHEESGLGARNSLRRARC